MFADRPLWMEIDCVALEHNYRALRAALAAELLVIPALKGNAYGHGVGPVAKTLARQDPHALAVGTLDDAREIRAVCTTPVLMFGGPLPEGFEPLLAEGFIPTVYNEASARAISAATRDPVGVFVKVDAGLGRLGVALEDTPRFLDAIARLPNIRIEGLYTHLTFHDAPGREWARARLARFDALLETLAQARIEIPVTQALASTGLLTGLESRANTVCPGSLLYGMCPVGPELCDFSGYRPAFRALKSRLIHTAGPVGVIPLGAADGMRRIEAAVGAHVLIGGQRVPIAGVSLEYTNLDLSAVRAAEGDEVVVIGASGAAHVSLDDVARWWGSNALHVLLSFGRGIPRVEAGV